MSRSFKFDEDDHYTVPRSKKAQNGHSGLIGWLVRNKIAKNEQIASNILIISLVILLIAIYFLWFDTGSNYKPHTHSDGKIDIHDKTN